MRLLHQHFHCDPATLEEAQLREYFLFVKLKKHWKPKTIRQALACQKCSLSNCWANRTGRIFSQIRAKDHDTLPAVLTRQQVQALLAHIRLRRYRTPLKLIYCCGLRLSECLGLTIHDIRGKENKLLIRHGKGDKDRVVPLPTPMYEELRSLLGLSSTSPLALSQCRPRRPRPQIAGQAHASGHLSHAL